MSSSSSYDIVVTGFAGSGKTTLINRIRGSTTEGDHDIQHVGDLKSTPCSLGPYDVVIWETPDVCATSEDDLKQFPKPSLVVLCIDVTSTRYTDYHNQMIDNMSRYFKRKVWKKCVIALIFADQLQTQKDTDEKCAKKREEWRLLISAKLISRGVSQRRVDKIDFIPTAFNPDEPVNGSLDELKSSCIGTMQARLTKKRCTLS